MADRKRKRKKVHTFCDDLFHKLTLCPELIRFMTTLDPILPSPIKPKAIEEAEMFLFFKSTDTLFKSSLGESCEQYGTF
jgi:hypothetical protein